MGIDKPAGEERNLEKSKPIELPPFIEQNEDGDLYLLYRPDAKFDATEQLVEFLRSQGKKLPEADVLDEILPGFIYLNDAGRIISEGVDASFPADSWEMFVNACPAL